MHDGTHYRLLSSRRLNDVVCDLFCALPIGMATSRYRYEHLLHHRFLNTDNDPYWVDFQRDDAWHWPKTPWRALGVFLKDVTGLHSLRWLPVQYRWSPWINHFSTQSTPPPLTGIERTTLYGFFVVVIFAVMLTGTWLELLLLWLLPLSTLAPALVRLRTICEHLAIPNRNELDASRHTDGTLFEHLTVAPFNINYHVDHHLFPGVPYYNLPKLHALLLKNPNYTGHAILNRTYFGSGRGGLLGEIIR
jgi:fatty acid desaturase